MCSLCCALLKYSGQHGNRDKEAFTVLFLRFGQVMVSQNRDTAFQQKPYGLQYRLFGVACQTSS